MALKEGIERTDEFRVEGDLLTDVEGTLPFPVLSTPGMISMMEMAAASLVRDELPPKHATVGFEVCVKHVGGALEGADCTVTARLRKGGRPAQAAVRRRGTRGRPHDRRRHPRAPGDRDLALRQLHGAALGSGTDGGGTTGPMSPSGASSRSTITGA